MLEDKQQKISIHYNCKNPNTWHVAICNVLQLKEERHGRKEEQPDDEVSPQLICPLVDY